MGTSPYTVIGGRFSPTSRIDLTTQELTIFVTGVKRYRSALSPGSFTETLLGGHVASAIGSHYKTNVLLQPFSGGDWAYSLGIEGFVPESNSVTFSLTIGGQVGSAKVEAFVLPKRGRNSSKSIE